MGSVRDGYVGGSSDAPTFLPEGAFVVQLKAGAAEDSLEGRAEHVVSGRAMYFKSPTELVAFLSNVLRPNAAPAQVREPRSTVGSRARQGRGKA